MQLEKVYDIYVKKLIYMKFIANKGKFLINGKQVAIGTLFVPSLIK